MAPREKYIHLLLPTLAVFCIELSVFLFSMKMESCCYSKGLQIKSHSPLFGPILVVGNYRILD